MLNTLFFKVDTENGILNKKVIYKTFKKIPYYSKGDKEDNPLFSDFRNDLNHSLNQFQTESKNDILYAKFTTKDRSTYDLDNILLYNVLKESTNNIFENGIICELKYSETFDNIYNHEYSYGLINKEEIDELFENDLKLFDFDISVFNKIIEKERKTILKNNFVFLGDNDKNYGIVENFALDLELSTNYKFSIKMIKDIIDSITLSLHYDNSTIKNNYSILGYNENKSGGQDNRLNLFRIMKKNNTNENFLLKGKVFKY
ncbi:hypothetical protein [Geotoga petraea]|uniref:Uncharacterized protein n=1 Tax=Geotoga petraea TaxID=28234 RepID=A0A4Z0W178_9BACT|nr:hypothetical protein [Geotoga petraea]TGG86975.1 hypothetical protein E4650_08945 [Geotoga petraea]